MNRRDYQSSVDLRLLAVIFCLLMTVDCRLSFADCTNPVGLAGDMIYDEDNTVLQYCDDTNWNTVLPRSAGTQGGGCTSPIRSAGTIIYNSSENIPQLCNGNWVALGYPDPAAAGGGCSSPARVEGIIVYDSDNKIMQYCDGSAWKKLFGPPAVDCFNVGDTCFDGSVYAGITPDGSIRMYVARCDIGMSWDGSSCTGTRTLDDWNNGSGTWIFEGYTSGITGEYNSDSLAELSDGASPHEAATDCYNLTVHGKSDWYLPALSELDVIYENLQDGIPDDDSPDPLISGFSAGQWYWSSREFDNNQAYAEIFSNGSTSALTKTDNRAIRCARK